jgi:hypothetical protein
VKTFSTGENPMIDIWISNGFVVIYDGSTLLRAERKQEN